MASQGILNSFNQALQRCLVADIGGLIHRDSAWGEINFDKARTDLENLNSMILPYKELSVERLPDQVLNQITPSLMNVGNTLERIRTFSIKSGNPEGTRDTICNELRAQIDALYPAITPHIPYLAYVKGDIAANISKLNEAVTRAGTMLADAKTSIETKQHEIGDIVVAAREAAASAGVQTFTADFSKAAEENARVARRWLWSTVGCATATIAAALLLLVVWSGDASLAAIAQRIVSKAVILGTLGTATLWCGRLYKATLHQQAINTHRANALKTFQAFVKAAADDTSRDAVLMETTRSIFALGSTGYLDAVPGGDEGGLKIVEVVKQAGQALHAHG